MEHHPKVCDRRLLHKEESELLLKLLVHIVMLIIRNVRIDHEDDQIEDSGSGPCSSASSGWCKAAERREADILELVRIV